MNPDDLRRIGVLGLANTSSIGFALRPWPAWGWAGSESPATTRPRNQPS